MSIKKKEVKIRLHGTRRILFDRIQGKKEVGNSALLREIIDYYFNNNPEAQKLKG